MATLALGVVGTAIGGSFGGSILGMSAATIGGMIGSAAGSLIDSWAVASLQPDQKYQGQRLDTLRITSSAEGAVIPRVFGRMRLGGNIIWATDFREEVDKRSQGGGKGGGPSVKTTEYSYFASFAVALCEGPISGVGRVWADGELMDLSEVTWRLYPGDEAQEPDPYIESLTGPSPAYRGTAYVVFEDLPLAEFGNRLPQISFEVFRPLADENTAEGMVRAVTMIPATGEFGYATQLIRKKDGGDAQMENQHVAEERADMLVSLDYLEALAPEVESVSLVVSWFGDDLRAGSCQLRPGVEESEKPTSPYSWSVNGVSRGGAHLVSRDAEGNPLFGGTPSDFSVVQAIREMKARGLRVTFYPFILMDVPSGNALPDPWSDNAAAVGQPPFPWRGRITCSPAPGFAGTVDKTATAAAQVTAFFGAAAVGDYDEGEDTVSWTGPSGDWGYRRMILHYAHLCAVAGGVDAFLIGSEMRGLTWVRSAASTFPAVSRLITLAADVRSILGAVTKISYAADWSEYFGHHPQDGSGDVFFHLDPLWADAEIDFIGIDNYMPLSDWRDGWEHLDAQNALSIYERDYLRSNIEGGEGFDWFYASPSARAAQTRTPITDGAAGKPWVFRYKDIRAWWSNQHRNRPGGVESGPATAWVPESKPIRFTELGCPAIDRGTNQPNVFVDPKSSESFVPYFSRGWRDDTIQRAYLEATLGYWREPAHNPVSGAYGGRMIDLGECAVWTWDARPYPAFPALSEVWSDGENWRLGHWVTGRLGSVALRALVRELCRRAGLPDDRMDVSALWGAAEGYTIDALESPRSSLSALARHFGFDAIESQGVIRFVMRGRGPAATIAVDDMAGGEQGEALDLVRGQETELPQALKWTMARSDEDYDPAAVEARLATVEASRIVSESFSVVVAPEEADRRCRRALAEAWVGRETAAFRLPPSRLALDPSDVIALDHDGRAVELRLVSIADGAERGIEAVRQDRLAYDMPSGEPRPARLSTPATVGAPEAVIMDLPQLRDDHVPHRPMIAAHANPWPGGVAVFRSESEDGFEHLTTLTRRATIGALASPLWSGPISRFDHGNSFEVSLLSGAIANVTDTALFNGANAFAVESAPGVWEILQAGRAELIGPRRYRLSRLLRGLRGTEWAMAPMVAAGARVVELDQVRELPIGIGDIGTPWNWRIGPASRPVSDERYEAMAFEPEGAGLRPFSPCHLTQPWKWARTPGDFTIRWIRRSRDLSADNWVTGDAPVAEESLSFVVEILDGAVVKRSLTTATTSAVYTAAQQTADWGAPLGPGAMLPVRVYQISAVIGRGTPRIDTLHF